MQSSATFYNFGFNIDLYSYTIIPEAHLEKNIITDKFFESSDILRLFNFRKKVKTEMFDLYAYVLWEFFQFFQKYLFVKNLKFQERVLLP
jgi:hypothetical protein